MEREGKTPTVPPARRRIMPAFRAFSRERASLSGRVFRTALAALLAVTVLPVVPGAPGVEEGGEAWAADAGFAGTTNYAQLFTWGNRYGSPSRQPDSSGRLRAASTEVKPTSMNASTLESNGDWGYTKSGGFSSSSTFITKNPISLMMSWTASFDAEVGTSALSSNTKELTAYAFLALSSGNDPLLINGPAFSFVRQRTTSGLTETLERRNALNGAFSSTSPGSETVPSGSRTLSFSAASKIHADVSYESSSDTLTAKVGATQLSISNVSKTMTTSQLKSPYLAIGGLINWKSTTGANVDPPSRNLNVAVTFKSFTLPHLSPTIEGLTLYRGKTSQVIGKNDAVQPGEVVRIECTVRNTHSQAGSEQFPMHLKTISTDQFPTQGLTLLRNSTYPVSVGGNPATVGIDSATGVPLTLVGGTAVKVVYYATVSGAAGGAVSIGQQLIEDSFGGTKEAGAMLVNERPLEPAPGTVDPDNPGSDAGHKFHYARFPQPNGNGWNNSPVTVRFYPGDFDQMTLTPSGGAAVTLTGASPDWVQAADTASTALSAQARNTATGAVSTQKAGTVKVDTTAPRLVLDPALDVLTVDDTAAVTSGVWKVHRTDSSGAVAADARAAVFKEFALTSGNGAMKQTVANIPNGWYVAEDAASNRSAPLKVDATEPPAVERPPGSVVNPDDPNPPTPVGPPVGPGDDVPGPTVSEDAAGLRHAVIEETVSEMIDPAAPPFGGLLEKAEATALMDYRYAASSSAGIASVTDELLDAAGAPLAAFDTKVPGGCLVRRVITDAQGNTTTINLHYQLTRDNCPPVRPLEPVDPADPSGPTRPGEPLTPDGPVVTDPDGTQHTEVTCEVTEAVSRGAMGVDGAVALLHRHYAFASVDGGEASATVQSMSRLGGGSVSEIDLSKAADYLITYRVADADGNTTTVKLTYHLVSSRAPSVVVKPDPGTDPNPQPGDDPLNPRPRPLDPVEPPAVHPDGTHHAVVEDEMRVPVEEGAVLSLADVRALMERRYTLTPENPGPLTERSLAVAAASGAPVTAIDRSTPGVFRITYQVADAAGNTVTVRLRYMVVADAPTVTPRPDPDGDGPGGSGGDGDGPGTPDDPTGGRDPLPPTSIVVDPATGLTHAVIEDTVTVATSHEPMTPAAMADLFALRYAVKSTLPDGKLTREPVHLYRGGDFSLSRAGGEVDAIDRSKPGDWRAEQRLVDSAGNTTTIKLTYLVREGNISGSVGDDGIGGNGAGPGDGTGAGNGAPGAGPSAGDGSATSNRWSSFIHQLPQTGGPFGSCPLHILFVLLMVLASAYTLMRLRQETARREQRRQRDAEWEEFRREAVR